MRTLGAVLLEQIQPKPAIKPTRKFKKVMGEYGKGKLKTSAGAPVTDPKQAVAIAASESGQSKKK